MFRYGKRTIIYGILIMTLLTGCNSKSAITSEPEEMAMSSTDNIRLFTQNSIRIQSEAGIIYIDPFQIKEEAHDADYILITHDHYDHFSPEDIRKVCKESSVMVVPEKMESAAGDLTGDVDMIYTIAPDMHKKNRGVRI